MAGICQVGLNAGLLQSVIAVDPIVAGAFHRYGRDSVGKQPITECMDFIGITLERSHIVRAPLSWYGDDKILCANIDPSGIRLGFVINSVLRPTGLVLVTLTPCLLLIAFHGFDSFEWNGARGLLA